MTKQELEDALDSLQETINRTVTERAEDRAAIRALEHRLRGARFILDGLQHMYPRVGLERSTGRLQVIALIDQTLKECAAAIARANGQEGAR